MKQILIDAAEVARLEMADSLPENEIMDAYMIYEAERIKAQSRMRFRMCRDEIDAMMAERNGQIPKIVKDFSSK